MDMLVSAELSMMVMFCSHAHTHTHTHTHTLQLSRTMNDRTEEVSSSTIKTKQNIPEQTKGELRHTHTLEDFRYCICVCMCVCVCVRVRKRETQTYTEHTGGFQLSVCVSDKMNHNNTVMNL